ncbi:hypothetical protein ACFQ5D_24275, partial [Paenibacillus farraposensis]
ECKCEVQVRSTKEIQTNNGSAGYEDGRRAEMARFACLGVRHKCLTPRASPLVVVSGKAAYNESKL